MTESHRNSNPYKSILEALYRESEQIFLKDETIEEFAASFQAFNRDAAKALSEKFNPAFTLCQYLMVESLLVTLAHHKDAPFYSFRKYFLENLRKRVDKVDDIVENVNMSEQSS